MADVEDWEDDGNDDGSQQHKDGNKSGDSTPRGLRAHAKKVDEENQQLKAKLAEFESAARKARVEKVLDAKGFDPAVAKIVPESASGDDAALDKWLTDNGGLLVRKQEAPSDVDSGEVADVLEEDTQGYMRVSQVASSAVPASSNANVRSKIMAADTPEALNAVLKQYGNKFVA